MSVQLQDTPQLIASIEAQVVADLSAPRPINPQVLRYLNDEFTVTEEQLDEFMADTFPTLEEYQYDVMFSPQLTPTPEDGQRYMALIGSQTVDESALHQMIDRLVAQNLTMPLQRGDGENVGLPLNGILIDRYITRLGLQKPLDTAFAEQLTANAPADRHEFLLLTARDGMFEKPFKQEALLALLKADDTADQALIGHLVDFLRTYRPETMAELRQQLQAYIDSCQKDQAGVTEHQFHHEELKAQYEDSDLQASKVNQVQERYGSMIQGASRLLELLPQG